MYFWLTFSGGSSIRLIINEQQQLIGTYCVTVKYFIEKIKIFFF